MPSLANKGNNPKSSRGNRSNENLELNKYNSFNKELLNSYYMERRFCQLLLSFIGSISIVVSGTDSKSINLEKEEWMPYRQTLVSATGQQVQSYNGFFHQ